MAEKAKQGYSADKAIKTSSEDVFNRKSFAVRLANALADTELSGGYVIGLYSPWGYGKTSTLNMVEEQLRLRKDTRDDIVVVKFNPWIFTNHQSMVSSLFNDLATSLGKAIPNSKEKIGLTLKKYAQAFQPLSVTTAPVGIDAGSAVDGLGQLLSNMSLEKEKDRLENILKEANKRVVVIVDDVDRLDDEEIFQLFKIIKVVVDFQNVSYVIAFDDKVVSKALAKRYGDDEISGRDFIDKIVQVPLHLPLIEQQVINDFTLKGIDNLLRENTIEIEQSEVDRFRLIFDKHIAAKIDSPRLANRYINSLRFVIPLVGEEINISDLLIIEGMRLLSPGSYNILRKQKILFTQGSSDYWGKDSPEEIREAIKNNFDKTPAFVIETIKVLFPIINNALKDYGGSYIDHKDLRESKRVASVDYFDRYFTYGIPKGDVSDLELLKITEKNKTDITSELLKLMTKKDSHTIIKKLRHHENHIKNIENVGLALVSLSNHFSDQQGFSFKDTDKEELAKFLVVLISKQPQKDRPQVILNIINEASDLSLLSDLVKWIDIESEKDNDQLLTKAQHERLFLPVAQKVKDLIQSKEKLVLRDDARHVTFLYWLWARGLGKEDIKPYFDKYVTDAGKAEELIMTYMSLWTGGSGSHYANLDSANYKYLIQSFDPDSIEALLVKKYGFDDVEWAGFSNHEYDSIKGPKSAKFRKLIARQFVHFNRQSKEPDNK